METAVLYAVLVCALVSMIHAYPQGPPSENATLNVCANMYPFGHGVGPLNGQREHTYEFKVTPMCYREGSTVEVTLYTTVDDEDIFFEGLFIQARDYYTHYPYAYGMFSTGGDPELRTHDCFDKEDSALSQSEAHHYFMKTFHWTAGYDHQMDLVFLSTVVFHTDQFWMNITSPMLKYDMYCGDDVMPPVGGGAGLVLANLPTMLSVVFAAMLAVVM